MTGRDRRRAGSEELLAAALAAGATYAQAASQAGMSERTARRRANDPAFVAVVGELRADFLRQAAGQLAANVSDAVATIASLARSESETIQLRAARAVIAETVRLHQAMAMEQRLAALEGRSGQ